MMMSRSYTTVTELPGSGASQEQLSMLYTRYRVAADLAAGKDVLELACGPGVGLGYLAKRARRVVGADCDPKLVEIARKHYGQSIGIHQMDAQHLAFDSDTFDVVLLLEAIYYLPHPERFLAETRRVLRENGTVLICSANREWPGFNPSPFSYRYYSARELQHLLRRAGYGAELFGAFPATYTGFKSHSLSAIRRIAVGFRLIPKTMHGKAIVKRLCYGRLSPLPAELTDGKLKPQALFPVNGRTPLSEYKVIYAIGHLTSRTQ